MRIYKIFCLTYVCLFANFSFAQDLLSGVWENGGRLISFSGSTGTINMKIVLKPYYRYVYEPTESFLAEVSQVPNYEGLNILRIEYPRMKQSVYLPICVMDSLLFTSFFQRNDYISSEVTVPEEYRPYGITETQALYAMNTHENPLYGFWTEQGSREGIMLYPNEAPEYFDAYFFTDTEYFKFRYWKDSNLARSEKQCSFNDSRGITFTVPRVLTRGSVSYSCVTANSSVLRNFEKGLVQLKYSNGMYSITLTPTGAGPGRLASKDTYENARYPDVVNLPLYLTEDGKIFSYGEPFLYKSDIYDLEGEIIKHNSQKKPIIEPQLVPDEIEFYKERIRELESLLYNN